MKEFVEIQSSKTIRVTAGLQFYDVTNKDAHVPDRLKVNPEWPKMTYLITEGKHEYPSYITGWNTVKSLIKEGILTVGEFKDRTCDAVVQEKSEEIRSNVEEFIKKSKGRTKTTLNEIAGE